LAIDKDPNVPSVFANMGQVLVQPVTTKDSGNGVSHDKGIAWGYSCMQGWRASMEDAHFAIPALQGIGWSNTAAFSVMDGHGGDQVARFCEKHLPEEIVAGPSSDVCGALIRSFHRMDELLGSAQQQEELKSLSTKTHTIGSKAWTANPHWIGCTAVVCLLQSDMIIVANAGDSRAVLCRKGQAVPLSEDHKPNLPGERARIMRAGGCVEKQHVGQIIQYRVNGNLNLSRSIGDLEYKKNLDLLPSEQMICSTPDVQTYPREADDEFLLLACDGIWDVIGSQDAVDFVRSRLVQSTRPLSAIMEEMLDHCLSPDLSATHGLGGDNMTAMVVVFAKRQEPTVHSDTAEARGVSSSHVTSVATVDEGIIVPAGLCGCRPG